MPCGCLNVGSSKGSNVLLVVVGSIVAFVFVICSIGAVVGAIGGPVESDDDGVGGKQGSARAAGEADGADVSSTDPANEHHGSHGKKGENGGAKGHGEDKPRGDGRPDPAPRKYLVTHVVDGDTIDLGNGETVRLVGIDTPERGECGYEEATENLRDLVESKSVTLAESDEDRDRYGRLLRYVDIGALDAGYRQLRDGYAVARYDSRDGYGYHPREPDYIKADNANPQFTCAPRPLAGTGGGSCPTGYDPCLPVGPDLDCADVDGPIRVYGSDPYQLDADGDGMACES